MVLRLDGQCENHHQSLTGHTRHTRHTVHIRTNPQVNVLRHDFAGALRPTVRDAIVDLPPLNDTTGARELPYEGQPSSALGKSLRGDGGADTIYDHMTRPVRDDDREAFKLMTASTLYSDLPAHLRRYRSDTFNDKYKRLDWDELSRTITAHIAKDGYWYIHPKEHRTLTVREAARIQTFPDRFRFAGTRSDAFRQIGNAVPPLLGRTVAEAILPLTELRVDQSRLPGLRSRLTQWAEEQRETTWWLYPGPDMTTAVAAVGAVLDVHRLPVRTALSLMAPLRGAAELSFESLQHIDVNTLSKTRKDTVRQLRGLLRESAPADVTSSVRAMLGDTQRRVFTLLCGGNQMLVNEHVAKVVTLLMELPEGQTGLRTDIKVALAQLLSGRDNAAARMCAIRAITVPEARARILVSPVITHQNEGESRYDAR